MYLTRWINILAHACKEKYWTCKHFTHQYFACYRPDFVLFKQNFAFFKLEFPITGSLFFYCINAQTLNPNNQSINQSFSTVFVQLIICKTLFCSICDHCYVYVSGNYYSLRQQHEKAVMYFQRALKLNPHYLSAWTLMGHEFMELKNTSAALQAYRQAIGLFYSSQVVWKLVIRQSKVLFSRKLCCFPLA